MARAPLYNDGSAVRTNPGNAGQISAGRGVSVDNLAGMVDVPSLDASGATAYARGASQFGDSISNLGDNFAKLAEQQARMLNSNKVREAQDIMGLYSAKIEEAWTKNPDETQWKDITNQMLGEADEALSGMNLSRAARDEVDSLTGSWKKRMQGETITASARKTRNDFVSDWKGKLDAAVIRGDMDMATRSVDVLREHDLITDGEADVMLERAESGVESAQKRMRAEQMDAYKNNVIALSQTAKPDEVQAWINEDYSNMGLAPDEKQYLLGVARQVERDQTADISGKLVDGIMAQGDEIGPEGVPVGIWNETMLDAAIGGSNFVSPALRAKMLDLIKERNKDVERGVVEQKKALRNGEMGTKAYFIAMQDAREWRPKSGTPEEADIAMATKKAWVRENVKDDLQGLVISELHKRYGVSGASKGSSDGPTEKVVFGRISDAYSREMAKVDAQIKALQPYEVNPKGEVKENPKSESDPQMVALRKKKDDLVDQQARVKMGMDSFAENKGGWDKVTREEGVKKLVELMSPEKAILDADFIEDPADEFSDDTPLEDLETPGEGEGIRIDPAGIMNDMPDAPAGPPENYLIPQRP